MVRRPLFPSSELPDGAARRFGARLDGREVAAFVLRHQGQVVAFVNRCLHRQIELDLGKGAFFSEDGATLACRAHGALYHPGTGACAGGLCPEGARLTPVAVEERDGTIWALDPP